MFFQSLTDGLGITDFGGAEAEGRLGAAQFAGMTIPELSPIELQRLVSAGEITPEFAEIIKYQGGNAFEDIYVDPRLKAQQEETLFDMRDISKTGMTAMDEADLARIASQESQAERGQREALIQQAQQRGLRGSGMDFASQLANQQGGATRRSARDTEVAGQASQRRMAALQEAGAMAGQLRSQEYGEQADVAKAQQMIDQFNTQNKQAQLAERSRQQNIANQANLSNAQRIMDQNVDLANQEERYRQSIAQQNFQNQLALSSEKAGAHYQMADMLGQSSSAGLQATAGLVGSLAMAGAYSGAGGAKPIPPTTGSDPELKENISMDSNAIDDFLSDITGYSFNYKDEEIGKGYGSEGNKVGVMADEMKEISPRMVSEDENKMKMLNNAEILPAVLASVGRLNDRLKKVEG